jgi:hypothetical protein
MRRSQLFASAITLGALAITPGCAGPQPLKNQFGNTLHYQAIDGPLELWFWTRPDGSYRGCATGVPGHSGADELSGSWRVVGGRNCRQQLTPPPPSNGGLYCEPLRQYSLEQTAQSYDGRFRVTLERGQNHGRCVGD